MASLNVLAGDSCEIKGGSLSGTRLRNGFVLCLQPANPHQFFLGVLPDLILGCKRSGQYRARHHGAKTLDRERPIHRQPKG